MSHENNLLLFYRIQKRQLNQLKAAQKARILEIGEDNLTADDYARMLHEHRVFRDNFKQRSAQLLNHAHRSYGNIQSPPSKIKKKNLLFARFLRNTK